MKCDANEDDGLLKGEFSDNEGGIFVWFRFLVFSTEQISNDDHTEVT